MQASVTASSASISAAISGATGLPPNAQIAGAAIIGLFSQTSIGIGHCASSLTAISAGQMPQAPADDISDAAFDKPFPACAGFPTDGSQPNISVQATAFAGFAQYMVMIIQAHSIEYEELRKETICSCANSVNSTNVQNVIDAWNNVTAVVNASASKSGNGPLILLLDITFSANLTIAMTATNNLLAQVTSCSSALTASIQQGQVRSCKKCTKNGGNDSDSGTGSHGSGEHQNTTCQQREQRSFTRKCHLANKKHEYNRRNCHKGNKSLFNRVRTHTQSFCDFIKSAGAKFQINIFWTFNASIKSSLNGFFGFIMSFADTVNANFTSATNASQAIITQAQITNVAAINTSIAKIVGEAADFANQIIGDAPAFPCCQDFLNQTVTLYQNASQNISDCAAQGDPIFDAISVNLTNALAASGDAFTNFTNGVDQCLHQNCIFPGWMCFNWIWFGPTCTQIQQCIDNVTATANAYAAQLATTLNATLTQAQAQANK